MLGTRTAVADLCMFGLAACDEGGPVVVNASVRTITNARRVGVRLQSKCVGIHFHKQVYFLRCDYELHYRYSCFFFEEVS